MIRQVDKENMDNKIHNALLDDCAEFGLVPTPKLRELIALDSHPAVQKLPQSYKITFMQLPEGQCILIEKDIVQRYVEGKCTQDEKFLLDLCDIRYWPTSTPKTD